MVLITLFEFCALLAMIKALLEARGLAKLLVLGAYAATFALQATVITMAMDGSPIGYGMYAFTALRLLGFGVAYMALATRD